MSKNKTKSNKQGGFYQGPNPRSEGETLRKLTKTNVPFRLMNGVEYLLAPMTDSILAEVIQHLRYIPIYRAIKMINESPVAMTRSQEESIMSRAYEEGDTIANEWAAGKQAAVSFKESIKTIEGMCYLVFVLAKANQPTLEYNVFMQNMKSGDDVIALTKNLENFTRVYGIHTRASAQEGGGQAQQNPT
jgi:hypothetical protein